MSTKTVMLGIVARIEKEGYCVIRPDALLNAIVNQGAFTCEEQFAANIEQAARDGILEALK